MKGLAGVDIGGTFTDFAVWDSDTRQVSLHKLLSTPRDPAEVVVRGLGELGLESDAIVHATTLVTNALIERRGEPVGVLCTAGYRDTVEIATELRYDPFDLNLERATPLAPRRFRVEVDERTGADGTEVQELDRVGVENAARYFVEQGVESIAITFLNSYRNAAHELEAAEIMRKVAPSLAVTCSAAIAPEIREYPRFSTGVANAFVQRLTDGYLRNFRNRVGLPLYVMLSDGGTATAETAADQPIQMVESGPAAGAMGASYLAQQVGWSNVIAFDMGGTTAKVSLIRDGVPERTHELEVGRIRRFKKGSGFPIRIPVIELIEIGAGGGSIASVDSLGLLQVGPRSASSEPGPVCYGRGGVEPTVTDADLVLGYLGRRTLLGGRMDLAMEDAEEAMRALGESLGLSPQQAAAGIVEIVDNNMATAAQVHVAEHGQDPRQFKMVAFGGAGPVHAYGLARLLHVSEVLFPRGAGVASAIGMLVAPRSVEQTRTLVSSLEGPDWDSIDATVSRLMADGQELLKGAGVATDDIAFEIAADLRCVGQGYEITVQLDRDVVTGRDSVGLAEAFYAEYRRRFDRDVRGLPGEVISWRVRASSPPAVDGFELGATQAPLNPEPYHRSVYFHELGTTVEAAVYSRLSLVEGQRISGPAIIEEGQSTIVVGPSAQARIDHIGNVIMSMDYRDDV